MDAPRGDTEILNLLRSIQKRAAEIVDELRLSRSAPVSSQSWRARAERCRAIAETFSVGMPRDTMLKVAEEYERMAEKAQIREGSLIAPATPLVPSANSPRELPQPPQ